LHKQIYFVPELKVNGTLQSHSIVFSHYGPAGLAPYCSMQVSQNISRCVSIDVQLIQCYACVYLSCFCHPCCSSCSLH